MNEYIIIEEKYFPDRWKVLVSCICLNRTNHKQVLPVLDELFSKYPNANNLRKADLQELIAIIRPLGLYNRRAKILIEFSEQAFMQDISEFNVRDLPGIGQYAVDCYMIMFEGSKECLSKDHALLKYIAHYEGKK